MVTLLAKRAYTRPCNGCGLRIQVQYLSNGSCMVCEPVSDQDVTVADLIDEVSPW